MTNPGNQGLRLPSGATLAPGENVLVADQFMVSTAAFFLHTELLLTNRRLYATRPNTFLGVIPVGTHRSNYPIENVAGVNVGTRFDVLGVIVGVVGLLFGIGAMAIPGIAILGILLILLGAGSIINSPKQAIEVMNSGGGVIRFPASILERGRTLDFVSRVAEAIARTHTAVVSGVTADPPAVPSSDPSVALRDLMRLHDQGLITESEYAAKRTEILTRL
jgi:hypothetical protein